MVRRSIARLRTGFARLAELVDARDLKIGSKPYSQLNNYTKFVLLAKLITCE